MKIFIKIILGIFSFMVVINIYVWWMSYLDWKKESSQSLQEIYSNLWNQYQIWSLNKVNKICSKDKKIGCLSWELKWISINGNDIYLYIKIYSIESILTYPDWTSKIWDYSYNLFMGNKVNNTITVKQKSDLPKYWHLLNNELKFYSENDLKNLSQEQQNIFKELEENPTIIINWFDYTKK